MAGLTTDMAEAADLFRICDQVSISPTFYKRLFCTRCFVQHCSSYVWALLFIGTKVVRKMLMKLTPGLNFINIICTAFTLADPESVKRY
jgi:hypothetical protein